MRIAILISGGGTTATAIFQACQPGGVLAEAGVVPACVIASGTAEQVGGVARLTAAGFPSEAIHVIPPGAFSNGEEFGAAMLAALRRYDIDFVGQYGWLAKTPTNVIQAFETMMVNQHPGPLDPPQPDFGGPGMYGRRVHAARLAFVRATKRDFWSEATVQRVGLEFDSGKVLNMRRVEILPEDGVPELQARMLPVEHEVQIETLRDFAMGKITEATQYVRSEPLVRPGEEALLMECKKAAKVAYPQG